MKNKSSSMRNLNFILIASLLFLTTFTIFTAASPKGPGWQKVFTVPSCFLNGLSRLKRSFDGRRGASPDSEGSISKG